MHCIWFDEFAENCVAGLERPLQAKHGTRYLKSLRTSQTDHSDAATTGRRSDGDNRIVQVHERDCSGMDGLRRLCFYDVEEDVRAN